MQTPTAGPGAPPLNLILQTGCHDQHSLPVLVQVGCDVGGSASQKAITDRARELRRPLVGTVGREGVGLRNTLYNRSEMQSVVVRPAVQLTVRLLPHHSSQSRSRRSAAPNLDRSTPSGRTPPRYSRRSRSRVPFINACCLMAVRDADRLESKRRHEQSCARARPAGDMMLACSNGRPSPA